MSYERLWERLLEFLNGWSATAVTGPDRIKVLLEKPDQSSRMLEIVMSPDEWERMVTNPWGDFDAAAEAVQKAVFALPDHRQFLVFADYELVPSATPDPPVDPEDTGLDELAQQNPDGFGRWVALDQQGNVAGEFEPPSP